MTHPPTPKPLSEALITPESLSQETPHSLLARLTHYRSAINNGQTLTLDTHHNALLILRTLRHTKAAQDAISKKPRKKPNLPSQPTFDLSAF